MSTHGTRSIRGSVIDRTRAADTIFAEGDIYKGDSPRILGGTPVYDGTSGGDINMHWERTTSSGSGLSCRRTLTEPRVPTPLLGETRNTIDVDFIHHFHISRRQQFSYGGGLRWSPYQIIAPIPRIHYAGQRS